MVRSQLRLHHKFYALQLEQLISIAPQSPIFVRIASRKLGYERRSIFLQQWKQPPLPPPEYTLFRPFHPKSSDQHEIIIIIKNLINLNDELIVTVDLSARDLNLEPGTSVHSVVDARRRCPSIKRMCLSTRDIYCSVRNGITQIQLAVQWTYTIWVMTSLFGSERC